GTQALFNNRVGWARTYLKEAGLLRSPKRGVFAITEDGRKLLAENPEKINVALLDRYDAFQQFRLRRRDRVEGASNRSSDSLPDVAGEQAEETPEDALAAAY